MECKPLLIHKGALWVGTESHGIHLFDLKTKQLIGHYTATSQTGRIPGNRVNCALQDSNGYIWIGLTAVRVAFAVSTTRMKALRLSIHQTVLIR